MARPVTLAQAALQTRTGDIWIFRGSRAPDRAIRAVTNAPVNHVGMAIVIEDLPPLLWHAELGRALPDVWTGAHHRGAQLHDLEAAVGRWREEYGQRAWWRQLGPEATREQENAALRAVARLDGVSFPSVTGLGWRWLRARDSYVARRKRGRRVRPEAAFCAQIVAETYQEMGLLPEDRRTTWYDPGTFWSGDFLPLDPRWSLGTEVEIL